MLTPWVDDLLTILCPKRCVLCRAASAAMALCVDCLQELPWLDHSCAQCAQPLALGDRCGVCAVKNGSPQTLAAVGYEYPIDRLVGKLKYRGDRACGRALGELLAIRVSELQRSREELPERLLPVPLHYRRARQRGYNQAELIARQLGADLGIVVSANMLRRVRPTRAQSLLGRSARATNLLGAFRCRSDVRGKRVAIVDDVVTTGATAQAAAAAVLAAGAAEVEVWAVARTAGLTPAPLQTYS